MSQENRIELLIVRNTLFYVDIVSQIELPNGKKEKKRFKLLKATYRMRKKKTIDPNFLNIKTTKRMRMVFE